MALVGSGPASLIAAYDLVRLNYRVTVFEALHKLGGVLPVRPIFQASIAIGRLVAGHEPAPAPAKEQFPILR